jgi:hypothetical protein
VCDIVNHNVAPLAKQCSLIQCSAPADCCPTLSSSSCGAYLWACNTALADAGVPGGVDATDAGYAVVDAGPPMYFGECAYYLTYCKCDPSKYACTAEKCVNIRKCPDADAGGPATCAQAYPPSFPQSVGYTVCNAGNCVACAVDADCKSTTQVCSNNTCVTKCLSNNDCADFYTCAANGTCTAGGCKSDRECISALNNLLAICSNTKCVIPCQYDQDCRGGQDGRLYVCSSGTCLDIGCETDTECQMSLNPIGNQRAVCRAPVPTP